MTAFWIAITAVLGTTLLVFALTLRRSIASLSRLLSRGERMDVSVPLLGGLAARFESRQSELQAHLGLLEERRNADAVILDGISEAVLGLDALQHVVLANHRFTQLFDLDALPVAKPLREIIRVAAVFAGIDRALAGEESVEQFNLRSGIVERTIEMRVLPVASERISAVALFIDVSRIERLEQIRRNFVSDFSHEARTPLAGLRSALDTYQHVASLSESEAEQLRRIMARQLLRLERLVEDLAELSRIESGDLSLSRQCVDLRRLVDDLCEDFKDRASHSNVRLIVRGEGVSVFADPVRIQQAVSNLIDNAIKHAGAGREVSVEIEDGGRAGIVKVGDQGEGIPPDEKERIFHRFHRIDKSRAQHVGGSGLGLAITKHLVLQHNGTIEVESEPGSGATFIIRLPKQ